MHHTSEDTVAATLARYPLYEEPVDQRQWDHDEPLNRELAEYLDSDPCPFDDEDAPVLPFAYCLDEARHEARMGRQGMCMAWLNSALGLVLGASTEDDLLDLGDALQRTILVCEALLDVTIQIAEDECLPTEGDLPAEWR